MAMRNGYKDILLIGRTGKGKSTTGNTLLAISPDGSSSDEIVHFGEHFITHFVVSTGPESCTKSIHVLANSRTMIRVTDVPGFGDSVRRADATVFQVNLQFIRNIVRANAANQFGYVLYFLPFREPPERADGNFREELEALYFYFGETIFDHMIMITTNSKRAQSIIPNAEDLEILNRLITRTLREATEDQYTRCPEILYVPLGVTHDQLLEDVLRFNPPTSPITLRASACIKCGCEYNSDKVYDRGGTKIDLTQSKCHPAFIPKYSIVKKIIHTAIAIVYFGIPYAIAIARGQQWPGFGNNEEMCIKCGCAPGSMTGCCEVGTPGTTPQGIPYPEVQHSSRVETLEIVE